MGKAGAGFGDNFFSSHLSKVRNESERERGEEHDRPETGEMEQRRHCEPTERRSNASREIIQEKAARDTTAQGQDLCASHPAKVRAALRMLSEGGAGGVAHSSPEVLQKLIEKHPKARDADPDTLLPGHFLPVPSSLFDALNGDVIQNIAMNSKGAAGPYGMDASDMRTLLCSKRLGRAATNLCEAIADLARRLCTEFVDPASLSAFLSCRLVPLEKGSNDIRPIGIGETLRRIVGKAVTRILKPEIQKSCGNLQVCAGIEGGCEAAIHSMREMFEDDENEAALLIDATNAFNAANRCATLHKISILCPAFYTYLCNTYRKVIRLFIPAWGKEIGSFEGTTQGDPAAMPMYALSVVPLIQEGERMVRQTEHGGQVWYADDATGVAKLEALRRWWDYLKDTGPKL